MCSVDNIVFIHIYIYISNHSYLYTYMCDTPHLRYINGCCMSQNLLSSGNLILHTNRRLQKCIVQVIYLFIMLIFHCYWAILYYQRAFSSSASVKGNHGTAISSLLGMIQHCHPLNWAYYYAAFHSLESIIVVVMRIYIIYMIYIYNIYIYI